MSNIDNNGMRKASKDSRGIDNIIKNDERYYGILQHGSELLEGHLKKYDFPSLPQALEYSDLPATMCFDHVPADKPLKILMVAEKPSLAREVARILSHGSYKCYENGPGKEKAYHFQYHLFGHTADIWMLSTYGHLNEQSFMKGTINGEEDAEAGLYAKIENVPCQGSISREFFTKLGRHCDAVILWLDNDHEGESISFEVIEYLLYEIKMPPSCRRMDAFFRARFSSPSEAAAAMGRLDRPNFKRYLAMVAKHHLDLRVGVPFSRYQKFAARDILDMYIWKLAFGPCSTVCVAIIVDHYLKTKDSPLKFCLEYVIDVDGAKLGIRSLPLNEDEANMRYKFLQKYDQCQVLEGPKDDKIVDVRAPHGLNTFELMEYQSEYYGRSAFDTAKLAQDLYEMGYITYPRSETTKYPADLKFYPWRLRENLSRLMNSDDIGFKPAFQYDMQKAMSLGRDKGDHPPIIPTDRSVTDADKSRLTQAHIEIYHYICRRYLASFMPDYQYSNKTVNFDMGHHQLFYEYYQNVRLGYTSLFPEMKVATPSESISAKLVPGAKFPFTVAVKECPRPSSLFEHELIKTMEKYNIGTDGSIPNHIAFIEREGYVKIKSETRELEPTNLAISMIEGYRTCIGEMIKPEYRARFIQAIEDIAAGQKDFVTVYNETLLEFNGYYHKFQERFPYYVKENQQEFGSMVRQKNNEDMSKAAEEVEALKKLKVVP